MLLPISGSRTLPAYWSALGCFMISQTSSLWYGLAKRVVVVGDADRALDPPVRRVQAVGVVLALEDHRVARRAVVEPAGLGDLVDQLVVGVDPDVAALGVVVVVGELPVDDLGQPARHRDRQRAAGAQHPDQLLDRVDVGVDVLEHLGRDDPVELAVGERQLQRVALLDVGLGARGHLARPPSSRRRARARRPARRRPCRRRHVGAAAVHLERVASAAAAHVEHPVARAQPQPVEVNGQHWCSPPALAR